MGKNVFLDCGANIGQGFDRLRRQYNFLRLPDLIVHMFEPLNDACTILEQKYPNTIVHNCAVWSKDETRILNIEHSEHPQYGNAVLGHTTNILEDDFKMPEHCNLQKMNEWPPKFFEEVRCINLSRFIKDNFDSTDTITLKLDIEGSEFEVLDTMIEDGTLSYITYLNIEWHPHMRKTTKTDNVYKQEFIKNGISILKSVI